MTINTEIRDIAYSYQAYGPAYLESVKTKSGETLVFEVADKATKPKIVGVKSFASNIENPKAEDTGLYGRDQDRAK